MTQSDQSELNMVGEDICSPVSDVDNLSLTEMLEIREKNNKKDGTDYKRLILGYGIIFTQIFTL